MSNLPSIPSWHAYDTAGRVVATSSTLAGAMIIARRLYESGAVDIVDVRRSDVDPPDPHRREQLSRMIWGLQRGTDECRDTHRMLVHACMVSSRGRSRIFARSAESGRSDKT